MKIKAPQDYGISLDKIELDSHTPTNLEQAIPFTLKANDFIGFVELDLKNSSDRNIVNALSNIKRAIENRMDFILFAFKYYELSKDWNFPKKMEKLHNLGIITPRILKKINRIRNLLEHQYQIPKKEEVIDAYDVAILFLGYTKNFLKKFVKDGSFFTDNPRVFVRFEFQNSGVKIQVDVSTSSIKAKDTIYDDGINLIIGLYY